VRPLGGGALVIGALITWFLRVPDGVAASVMAARGVRAGGQRGGDRA
jgi:hypothetical protein